VGEVYESLKVTESSGEAQASKIQVLWLVAFNNQRRLPESGSILAAPDPTPRIRLEICPNFHERSPDSKLPSGETRYGFHPETTRGVFAGMTEAQEMEVSQHDSRPRYPGRPHFDTLKPLFTTKYNYIQSKFVCILRSPSCMQSSKCYPRPYVPPNASRPPLRILHLA
jgi:hypothetical protein